VAYLEVKGFATAELTTHRLRWHVPCARWRVPNRYDCRLPGRWTIFVANLYQLELYD